MWSDRRGTLRIRKRIHNYVRTEMYTPRDLTARFTPLSLTRVFSNSFMEKNEQKIITCTYNKDNNTSFNNINNRDIKRDNVTM